MCDHKQKNPKPGTTHKRAAGGVALGHGLCREPSRNVTCKSRNCSDAPGAHHQSSSGSRGASAWTPTYFESARLSQARKKRGAACAATHAAPHVDFSRAAEPNNGTELACKASRAQGKRSQGTPTVLIPRNESARKISGHHRAYARATPDIPHSPSIVWPAARSQGATGHDTTDGRGQLDANKDQEVSTTLVGPHEASEEVAGGSAAREVGGRGAPSAGIEVEAEAERLAPAEQVFLRVDALIDSSGYDFCRPTSRGLRASGLRASASGLAAAAGPGASDPASSDPAASSSTSDPVASSSAAAAVEAPKTNDETAQVEEAAGELPTPLEFSGRPANQGKPGNVNVSWSGGFGTNIFNPSGW